MKGPLQARRASKNKSLNAVRQCIKIQMLEQIARDSVASDRENNAIGAIRLLAELTGFGVDQKR